MTYNETQNMSETVHDVAITSIDKKEYCFIGFVILAIICLLLLTIIAIDCYYYLKCWLIMKTSLHANNIKCSTIN